MKHIQNHNKPIWSFIALVIVMGAMALTSCSKKDIKEDEAGFNPTEDASGTDVSADASATDLGPAEAVTTGSAGDSFAGASELQTAYFEFDSYNLTAASREALKRDAKWLSENPSVTIQIEGHCDERGTTEYNLALGERRANAARDYLQKLGVESSRMSVISYGEERPAEMGSSDAAWAKNRRAQFAILSR